MIKLANNLQRLAFVKLAETEEEKAFKQVMDKITNQMEKARIKDRRKAEKGEVPNEERRVDYAGRARRGALMGALLGAVPGAIVGGNMGADEARYSSWPLLQFLGGGAAGALGGAALGGAGGALGNMLGGFLNSDTIERRPEPNRLRRGLTGALLGIYPGALAGGILGGDIGDYGYGLRYDLGAGTILGGLGGAGLGYLGGAYLGPYLNKDMFSQKYLQDKDKS